MPIFLPENVLDSEFLEKSAYCEVWILNVVAKCFILHYFLEENENIDFKAFHIEH